MAGHRRDGNDRYILSRLVLVQWLVASMKRVMTVRRRTELAPQNISGCIRRLEVPWYENPHCLRQFDIDWSKDDNLR